MSETLSFGTAIGVLALLQLKHMFADFFLQTPMMLRDRGTYLHLGRALHCFIHAFGTALAVALFGLPMPMLLALAVVDGLVHFHIDWAKGRWSEARAHKPEDAGYWRAFGVDQMLHQLTYLGLIWAAFVL